MGAELRVLRHNVRMNLMNGIAWSIGFNFVLPFAGVLAARMGADNTQFAYLSSVPALMTLLVTLPGAFLIEQFRSQKRITAVVLLLCRLLYVPMAFVMWFPSERVNSLIFLVGLYTALSSVVGVVWQAMMGELIPTQYRNRVFADRNLWSGAVGMIITLIAGWFMDRIPFPAGYQLAFGLGLLAALIETFYFYRIRVPREEGEAEQVPTAAVISRVSRNSQDEAKDAASQPTSESKGLLLKFAQMWRIQAPPAFYLMCASAVVFIFAWQAAWPVYLKVKVDTLHATNLWMSVDTVAGALGSLLAFQAWAKVADRVGNAKTVFLSSMMLAFTPFLWLDARSMLLISVYDFIGGAVTAGFNQSLFNRVLETVPTGARQRAIAVYTTMTQVSAIIAPIVGMKAYESMPYAWAMSSFAITRIVGSVCFLIVIGSWVTQRFGSPRDASL